MICSLWDITFLELTEANNPFVGFNEKVVCRLLDEHHTLLPLKCRLSRSLRVIVNECLKQDVNELWNIVMQLTLLTTTEDSASFQFPRHFTLESDYSCCNS